ncbi:4-oxalocrotonate tautomerase family protein [Cohnella sp.]|uniref:tautomerase family protein n=1 Tax=Cohnella sp. TaxID=1883426 RepID=UPI00356823A0
MPKITIRMYEGRTQSQKDELVEVFTREMSRIIERESKHIHVDFDEIPVDDNAPEHLKKARNDR